MKKILAKISSIHNETPTIKRFVFDLNGSIFEFLPGQWLDLYATINGKVEVGGYSITSSPSNKVTVEIAVKYSDRHKVTRYLHEQAQVGESFELVGGDGNCFYQKNLRDNVILIAAGIGITPIMSIIRYICDAQEEIKATLLYCASSYEELAFREELEALALKYPNFTCIFTLSREESTSSWTGHRCRIDTDFIKSLNLYSRALYYVCGPQKMIEDTVRNLKDLGVSNALIHYEKW